MEEPRSEPKQQHLKLTMLTKYGTDLTQSAKEGKLDPIIGRDEQIKLVTQILCKRKKNNPCLVGDPGVGKTVIAEALAQGIVNGSVPVELHGKKLFSLDLGRLIGGTSHQGDFEERLTLLVDEIKETNGLVILFIDELHSLIGMGSRGTALDAANLLKQPLARGDMQCVAATTFAEYKKYIEKDPGLARQFQIVKVPEPTIEETIIILSGLKKKYEVHHNVEYSDDALDAAARLSSRYIRDRYLPDKAIDLIDEAGSFVRHNKKPDVLVKECDVRLLISKCTGIRINDATNNESRRLLKFEETLKKCVVGQNEAVEAISRAVRRSGSGVRDPKRPIASFLFTGQTGVGKTELANAVASEYFGSSESMIRFDMSEYMENHSVSKLTGSPPGYVGYDEGGHLTDAVRKKPHNLILFDEIEKAHSDVFNLFLQILDYGRLTDSKGRAVDFTNTIIVMTSNIGSNFITDSYTDQSFATIKGKVINELKKTFKPELLNRLNEMIVFRRLTKSDMTKIVEVMLEQVAARLLEKDIHVSVTEDFKAMLIDKGYNPSYGARPLKRAVVTYLEDKLAEKLLGGGVKQGHRVTFDFCVLEGVKITSKMSRKKKKNPATKN